MIDADIDWARCSLDDYTYYDRKGKVYKLFTQIGRLRVWPPGITVETLPRIEKSYHLVAIRQDCAWNKVQQKIDRMTARRKALYEPQDTIFAHAPASFNEGYIQCFSVDNINKLQIGNVKLEDSTKIQNPDLGDDLYYQYKYYLNTGGRQRALRSVVVHIMEKIIHDDPGARTKEWVTITVNDRDYLFRQKIMLSNNTPCWNRPRLEQEPIDKVFRILVK